MTEINYRRITDWNKSFHGLDLHLSFEAGFSISEAKAIILTGRIIDSQGRELFRSQDLSGLNPEVLQRDRQWNPTETLANFIHEIEFSDIKTEPAYFSTLMHEMTLEVKYPVVNDVCGVIIHIPECIIMGEYYSKDSGLISVSILCERNKLLQFLKSLQVDLSRLLEAHL